MRRRRTRGRIQITTLTAFTAFVYAKTQKCRRSKEDVFTQRQPDLIGQMKAGEGGEGGEGGGRLTAERSRYSMLSGEIP